MESDISLLILYVYMGQVTIDDDFSLFNLSVRTYLANVSTKFSQSTIILRDESDYIYIEHLFTCQVQLPLIWNILLQ